MTLIEKHDADMTNLVELMRQMLMNGKATVKQQIEQQKSKIKKLERVKKRIRKKDGGGNLFAQMLDGQIGIIKRGLELGASEIETVDELLAIVAEYEYSSGWRLAHEQLSHERMCAGQHSPKCSGQQRR